MQILRIDSSTTGDQSITRKLTDRITAHLKAEHADATWVERDLAADPLPHIDPVTTSAIRTPPETHEEAVAAAYPDEQAVLEEFRASDIVVIGAPMYNFTIPSQLKAWIDRLGVPRVSFRYTEDGPEGLLGGRRVVIASARGGTYEQGGAAEHQETLLKTFFNFIGVDDITFIRVNNAGFGEEAVKKALAEADEAIAAI